MARPQVLGHAEKEAPPIHPAILVMFPAFITGDLNDGAGPDQSRHWTTHQGEMVTCAKNKPVWFCLARVMLLKSGGELCVLGGNRSQVGASPNLMLCSSADGRMRVYFITGGRSASYCVGATASVSKRTGISDGKEQSRCTPYFSGILNSLESDEKRPRI